MRASWMMVFVLATGLAACKKDKKEGGEEQPAEQPSEQPTEQPEQPAEQPEQPAAANLTEIGIPDAKTPVDGVVTGGQVTDEHLAKAKEMGVKTVVNLRSEGEKAEYETEQAKAEELGMKYIHMPIDSKTGEGLDEANAKKLAEILEGEEKPMIVHCKSGQRVGALFALKAHHVDGKSPEEALEIGTQAGLSAPPLVEMVQKKMAGDAGDKK
ncbi:MAG TPA: sulfur transferase domain-containing protein [Kofleriaceae bacterium]|nr:sulfur transferase domain-containing protein [Kofleriaceae bacterium]